MRERVSAIEDRAWFTGVGALLGFVQLLAVLRVFLKPGRPLVDIDAAFYEHAGWYQLQGAVPYVDFWDPKPPLNFVVTRAIATVGGDSMLTIHVLNVALTSVVTVGTCLCIGYLATNLTGDRIAGLAAAVFPLVLPRFHLLPAYGFRPKYFFLFFGFLGLVLFVRERHLLGAVVAGLSTGFWQFGVVFVGLVLGLALARRDADALKRAIGGTALAAALVLSPVVYWGVVREMFVETVISSIETTNSTPITQRIGLFALWMGYGNMAVAVAGLGFAVALKERFREWWWAYAGAAAAALQMLVIDMEGHPDSYFLLVFLAFGVAMAISISDGRRRTILASAVAFGVVVSVVFLGGFGVVTAADPGLDEAGERDTVLRNGLEAAKSMLGGSPGGGTPPDPLPTEYTREYMRTIFWDQLQPETCHYRVGNMHRTWIEKMEKAYDAEHCGRL